MDETPPVVPMQVTHTSSLKSPIILIVQMYLFCEDFLNPLGCDVSEFRIFFSEPGSSCSTNWRSRGPTAGIPRTHEYATPIIPTRCSPASRPLHTARL